MLSTTNVCNAYEGNELYIHVHAQVYTNTRLFCHIKLNNELNNTHYYTRITLIYLREEILCVLTNSFKKRTIDSDQVKSFFCINMSVIIVVTW